MEEQHLTPIKSWCDAVVKCWTWTGKTHGSLMGDFKSRKIFEERVVCVPVSACEENV